MTHIFDRFKGEQAARSAEFMGFDEYLNLCKSNKLAYATAAERMLSAIGEPQLVDTSKEPRLSRIFLNRTVRKYPAFNDFFGMEEAIERIVGYFKHSAQGLEERKQILYLLGPVGGGKSSLAERLKELMQKFPIYVLADKDNNLSPVFETPLNLFDPSIYASDLEKEYGIEKRYISGIASPWAIKRLKESADRLLLDVPCSGLGVLRRNPDTKWKLSPESIQKVQETQQEILQSYPSMLKKGGQLVYATCSVLPSENEEQIKKFLASEAGKDFELLEDRKVLAQESGFDGFYIARLLKK